MIFLSKEFYIEQLENKDLKEVLEVYNSNGKFLTNHIDKSTVTNEWITEELEYMKDSGFRSCKVIHIATGKIVGIMDFKVDEEIYLSLLMIHNDFQGKGFGKIIYNGFEEYVKSLKRKCIRIDVVINYDNSILKFWKDNGFVKSKDIELNWAGKALPAVTMKKYL
ncbi:GNAT family N-acetyltransferase [Tissierella sp. MB52-C2]|uniref:GNAT family N-acetyltransferase n=1 Tax=Tissierella sp. MB52-C2 TaxID=3070999 RepID=UPI00280ACB4C|nr:GNAT family N-acetyltransferase [Tissierella sp. MB52-C2]WMM24731.1 GNAT family N-acetyltransferase [Tissierella sp. MB52-C2]